MAEFYERYPLPWTISDPNKDVADRTDVKYRPITICHAGGEGFLFVGKTAADLPLAEEIVRMANEGHLAEARIAVLEKMLASAVRYIEVSVAYEGAMTAAEVEERIKQNRKTLGPVSIAANSVKTLATFNIAAARDLLGMKQEKPSTPKPAPARMKIEHLVDAQMLWNHRMKALDLKIAAEFGIFDPKIIYGSKEYDVASVISLVPIREAIRKECQRFLDENAAAFEAINVDITP